MGEQKNKKVSEEEALAEANKMLNVLKEKESDEASKEKSDKKENKEDNKEAKIKVGKAKVRSEKYKKAFELVDRKKLYSLGDALDLLKKTSYSKFDGSAEVHFRLESGKKGDMIRGLMQLPHGTGKNIKVVVIDEKLIDQIIKDKGTKYDILIATPDMMPKIARIAKILGPLGKMPNPKSGTVTSNPNQAMEEIKSGKTEYKADKQNIVHLVIGKVSWDKNKLEENFKAAINALSGKKLQSVIISATMGPGIKIAYK
jgi:large subunit ribosomal protein L1